MEINTINIDFDLIPVDNYWNSGDKKENRMHKIHSYPAKFPAFITNKAIKYAENKRINISLIADMFCGCGTTAYEASINGKDFWGSDINPVATLIAKTKSKTYKKNRLIEYFEEIIEKYYRSESNNDIKEINERIKYWYKTDQIIDLLSLKESIKNTIPNNSKYRLFFLTAFSNILKPTSVWLTKSIKPQVDPKKTPADVIGAFKKQFKMMVKANRENNIPQNINVKIDNINFLNKKIKKPFADLVITSPPYITSYEYADLHQLSTLWLGYAKDYRVLRKGTIGSLYHNSNFNKDAKRLNKTGEKIVFLLYNKDKKKAKSAAKYYIDMQESVDKSYRMINNNGMIVYVIGNTQYKSIHINNAKHLVESMINSGFKDINITKRKISNKTLTPYRDEKGRFTNDKNSRKVYSEEFIVIGRKYNG